MALRQSRQQARLQRFRMLSPGSVDHEIDTAHLVQLPEPCWDDRTLGLCRTIYHRCVRPGTGGTIPDVAFCDLPRWVFLEYLIRHCDLVLFGSNSPDLTCLEPVVLSRNLMGWEQPRYYAFSNSSDALFHAVLDTRRLRELDCGMRSTLTRRSLDPHGRQAWQQYIGIDYRALPFAPWCQGTVYLIRKADLPADYETVPCRSFRPVPPVGRLQVNPWDWPLLDRVHGVDVPEQTERQWESFRGFPWIEDPAVHPNDWKRPVVEEIRGYLDANYGNALDLTGLAKRFGMSPFSLLRMFRAVVGLSPREYLAQRRIAAAKHLLVAGSPIAQVAAAAGFYDQSHLTRHFRRLVGTTPAHYLRVQENPIPQL